MHGALEVAVGVVAQRRARAVQDPGHETVRHRLDQLARVRVEVGSRRSEPLELRCTPRLDALGRARPGSASRRGCAATTGSTRRRPCASARRCGPPRRRARRRGWSMRGRRCRRSGVRGPRRGPRAWPAGSTGRRRSPARPPGGAPVGVGLPGTARRDDDARDVVEVARAAGGGSTTRPSTRPASAEARAAVRFATATRMPRRAAPRAANEPMLPAPDEDLASGERSGAALDLVQCEVGEAATLVAEERVRLLAGMQRDLREPAEHRVERARPPGGAQARRRIWCSTWSSPSTADSRPQATRMRWRTASARPRGARAAGGDRQNDGRSRRGGRRRPRRGGRCARPARAGARRGRRAGRRTPRAGRWARRARRRRRRRGCGRCGGSIVLCSTTLMTAVTVLLPLRARGPNSRSSHAQRDARERRGTVAARDPRPMPHGPARGTGTCTQVVSIGPSRPGGGRRRPLPRRRRSPRAGVPTLVPWLWRCA